VDRVLFVSDFQAKAFAAMYDDVPSFNTGNYIDPDDYAWQERQSELFTLPRATMPLLSGSPCWLPSPVVSPRPLLLQTLSARSEKPFLVCGTWIRRRRTRWCPRCTV